MENSVEVKMRNGTGYIVPSMTVPNEWHLFAPGGVEWTIVKKRTRNELIIPCQMSMQLRAEIADILLRKPSISPRVVKVEVNQFNRELSAPAGEPDVSNSSQTASSLLESQELGMPSLEGKSDQKNSSLFVGWKRVRSNDSLLEELRNL